MIFFYNKYSFILPTKSLLKIYKSFKNLFRISLKTIQNIIKLANILANNETLL